MSKTDLIVLFSWFCLLIVAIGYGYSTNQEKIRHQSLDEYNSQQESYTVNPTPTIDSTESKTGTDSKSQTNFEQERNSLIYIRESDFDSYKRSQNYYHSRVGDLDCPDFSSQRKAQNVHEQNWSDPHRLDGDNDGIACEALYLVEERVYKLDIGLSLEKRREF